MAQEDEKQSLDPREMSLRDSRYRLRGVEVRLVGARKTIEEFEDVAFLEMPHFFVEHDGDGPFLKVVTETAHYKLRLEPA